MLLPYCRTTDHDHRRIHNFGVFDAILSLFVLLKSAQNTAEILESLPQKVSENLSTTCEGSVICGSKNIIWMQGINWKCEKSMVFIDGVYAFSYTMRWK